MHVRNVSNANNGRPGHLQHMGAWDQHIIIVVHSYLIFVSVRLYDSCTINAIRLAADSLTALSVYTNANLLSSAPVNHRV